MVLGSSPVAITSPTTLTEKQQKTSSWSSGKINKYEYVTGEEILPSNQRQLIEQAKFVYFPL